MKVSEVLEEINRLTFERLKLHSITFEIEDFNDDVINVKKVEVIQSIMALMFNSMDAIRDQSEKWIKLRILNGKKEIAFIIQDSGPRIPEEIAGKMMLPFFITKPPEKSTGLGLSVAKTIAKSYRGDLLYDIESPYTTFIFRLSK